MPPTAIGAAGPATSSAREKLEIVWSPVDETPIFTLTGGKDAPHPNATKLYLTWFLPGSSRAASARSRRASTCRMLPTDGGGVMTNDKLVADLRKSFEGYAGPPANKGGVRLAC